MKLFNFIKSASPEANKLTICAAAVLGFKIGILNGIPAPLPGMYEAGIITESILGSVIASYIFYLIVIRSKEVSDRATLQPYFDTHFTGVIFECETILKAISKISGTELKLENLDRDKLLRAVSLIHSHDEAPLILGSTRATWPQYLDFHMQRSREHITKLLLQLPHLTPAEIRKLTNIDECEFYHMLNGILKIPQFRQSLEIFSRPLYNYCSHCLELSKHSTFTRRSRTDETFTK